MKTCAELARAREERERQREVKSVIQPIHALFQAREFGTELLTNENQSTPIEAYIVGTVPRV